MLTINNHWLNAEHVSTEKVTGKDSGIFSEGFPDMVVIHYTGGPSLRSALNTFKNPQVKASAHILIDYDGAVTQLIPFNRIAWHAGASRWGDRHSLNRYAIGIEIVNPGYLTRSGTVWRGAYGDTYAEQEVMEAVHQNEKDSRWWRVYEPQQMEACHQLCELLIQTYGIKEIVGHDEISPGRKQDPGPAFPMDRFRGRLLNNDRSDEIPEKTPKERRQGTVTASSLNIRKAPDTNAERVTDPLPKGTSVRILNEENGWYEVETVIKGWVSAQFVSER